MKSIVVLTAIACASTAIFAGQPASPVTFQAASGSEMSSDLTLGNFFSEGWDQNFTRRDRGEGAPDVVLLRTQSSFLQQKLEVDYEFENNVTSRAFKDFHLLDAEVALPLNRRLMLALVYDYEWRETRPHFRQLEGESEALVGRLQLVDTQYSSYSFNFVAHSPNDGIGVRRSALTYALAGWNDLTPLGLPRMGLYYDVAGQTLVGYAARGDRRNNLNYTLSLAKTWTAPDAPCLRNFTTFLEAHSLSDLDGAARKYTNASLTPGLRFGLGKGQEIVTGISLPLTTPRLYSAVYTLSYLYNF